MPKPSARSALRGSPGTITGSRIEPRKSGCISTASASITVRCTERNERPSGVPKTATNRWKIASAMLIAAQPNRMTFSTVTRRSSSSRSRKPSSCFSW